MATINELIDNGVCILRQTRVRHDAWSEEEWFIPEYYLEDYLMFYGQDEDGEGVAFRADEPKWSVWKGSCEPRRGFDVWHEVIGMMREDQLELFKALGELLDYEVET
jgi:hypothetical protein